MEKVSVSKNLIFLSLVKIDNLEERGIYQDLLRQLIKEGHKVTVVCPLERKYNLKTRKLIIGNLTILQVKTLNIQKCSLFEKGLATITINYLLKRNIKKNICNLSFDVILYATPPITFLNLVVWLKAISKGKTYLLLKDIFPQNAVDMGMIRKNSILHNYFRRIEERLYEVSDKIGCMSPANLNYLIERYPEIKDKIEINPNSIEIFEKTVNRTDFSKIRSVYNVPKDSVVFLYGGNLGKPQGVEFLMPVIKEIEKLANNVYFLIAGDGTDFSKLSNWFEQEKPKNAQLIRSLPREEYQKIVSISDVGLILLRKDFTIPNFPSRLLSYMENKLPVLCFIDEITDIGKIAKENNFGDWSVYGDLEEAVNKIVYLANQSGLRNLMGENAYLFLKEEFNIEKTTKLIIENI